MREIQKNLFVESYKGTPALYARTRRQWRQWLQKNHAAEKAVLLILFHKKSGKPGVRYEEAVEEALCFGWIDSRANKRDGESYYQRFTPRNPKSKWSKPNRERVERMIRDGLMTPAGQAFVDLAKKTGTWTALDDIENTVVPEDLQKRFARNKKAFENFKSFSTSSQRLLLGWISEAKRPETRSRRIEQTVAMAAKNVKAYPPGN